jgi:hypothetical protein
MAEYCAYLLRSDGRIFEVVKYASRDDDGAQDYANQIGEGREVELWQGKRHVARLRTPFGRAPAEATRTGLSSFRNP